MFKPLQLFIGLRYTRARRRNHFVSFISASSMLGIAIGVTALITVLSVMNGFETELRERILGMVSHGTVSGYQRPLQDWEALTGRLQERGDVRGAAPYVDGQVMLTRGGEVTGAMVRGILPAQEGRVSTVGENVTSGSLQALEPGDFGIVLGRGLADRLGVGRGDKVTMVTPEARASAAGILPRLRRFEVVGVFSVDMSQYDNNQALIHLEDAQVLFRLDGAVTGIRLAFEDLFQAPRLVRGIAEDLPGIYRISDWTMQNRNFFRAVQTEKTVMFVILMLIVGVAAFNIVSTLVMVVTDKQSDIAILRTLGATPRGIMGIFIVQGAVLGVVGTLLGVAGGTALALNVETIVPAIEAVFNTEFLPADVYLISDLPSELHSEDVVRITIAAIALSLIATLYPAWRASRVAPAEALRYE
ncbi:lipoprotein-releasing ABC transporter permease subunit [Arhodomonas sp. SL1]|uniref:lipoprotein-releasing ABC transporter permease subunit n=1 Tax=Arhodomonas sp. SL1 TaxID=3425691 RepID=UPI003F8839E0